MSARKKSKRTQERRSRCASVVSPHLAPGWACCACYRKLGAATYNGKDRTSCKQCGHERCAGAMRRKWPPETVGVGLREALMHVLGALVALPVARATASDPAQDPRWLKACDDVVAAFAAARLRAQHGTEGLPIDMLEKSVHARLARAAEIFGPHPKDAPPCRCRHYSIIAAGAEITAEATGADFELLTKSGMRVLDWYLSSRS